jgi:uncharacterized membrane protein YhaH (DUF805 family)
MKEQLKNMFAWNNFFTFSGRVTGFQSAIVCLTWSIISFGFYLLTLLFSLEEKTVSDKILPMDLKPQFLLNFLEI